MTPLDLCPGCQAPHGPDEAICWMCGHKFWKEPNAPRAAAAPEERAEPAPAVPPPPIARPGRRPFAAPPSAAAVEASARESAAALDRWTQPVLLVSFFLVLGGVAFSDKASGGGLLLLGLVPALFLLALSGMRPSTKKPETGMEWAAWVASKVAGAIAIIVLAGLAITAALFIACAVILAALGLWK